MQSRDDIFLAARDLAEGSARSEYLAGACGADSGLRARIEAMLEAASGAERFFEGTPRAGARLDVTEQPGAFIERYKLLEKLGEGGFGVVYVAEQQNPVKRRVALKIIKLGMNSRQVVARFEAERQALALMDHPHIAKVHDGGTTGTGRPYFVMELVRGLPINQYCAEHQLSVPDRLRLFASVCHAVQHAHQKGIIHRDLKPSNILITVNDGQAVPKVIDFGVAKATQQELTDKTIYTQFHHLIGTPAYMSPEQVEMTSIDIDTRSDIYSLGVLLYELLTGSTPFDGKDLLASGLDEMRRTIREQEPLTPSTRLSRQRGSPRAAQRVPQTFIDPDLDCIVMKCLEKDRTRRYETANGLAADIERHLSNEPIVARPPSALYRVRKLIRRNRVACLAATGISLALVAGITTSLWQAARLERERARAERRLRASLEFIEQMFGSVSPNLNALIGGGTVNRAMTESGLRLMEEFRKDPDSFSQDFRLALAQLQTQLGFTQSWPVGNTTGDYEGGLKSATEAIALLQPAVAETLDDTRMCRLARAEMVAGYAALALRRHEEALSHFHQMERWAGRAVLSTNQASAAEATEYKLWAPGCLGEVLMQMGPANIQRAIDEKFLPLLRDLRQAAVANSIGSNRWAWAIRSVTDDLGVAYSKLEKPTEALPLFREAHGLTVARAARYPNNADISHVLVESGAKLGEVLVKLQQPEEGLRLLETSIEEAEKLIKRDKANAGFGQLRITVMKHYVHAMIAWSGDVSSSPAERQQRWQNAHSSLQRAETLLTKLPTESAKSCLRPELEEARSKLAEARSSLAIP